MNEPKDYKAIMLSSTFTDLKEHRQRAIEVIEKLGYFPRVMEFSGAQAESDVIDASLHMVRDGAAYVGVISLKYGQTPFDEIRNPDRLSVTELEFNEAMRLGRPIVLFIMDDDHPVRKVDIEFDPDKLGKLDRFRERAKRMREGSEVQRVYEGFGSEEQFATTAATALGNLVRYLERMALPKASGADHRAAGTVSNITVNIPFHFLGREEGLSSIEAALGKNTRRAAITTLYGLRGVGKTTLAAAYAEWNREKYDVTWWIRAETESTMRADLVGLGVQLGWVAANAVESDAARIILDRLQSEGEKTLLVYDNAVDPKDLMGFLPRGVGPRIIVTSNAPNWGAIAAPIEIEVWQKDVGADFLIARTGRGAERDGALALSEALGGLPLAHEKAAAYCERTGISLGEYLSRFEQVPGVLLDDPHDLTQQYGRTVSKTFSLAIEEATKRHPAAASLIVYAALLAPEPIPLYLFSEGHDKFSKPLALAIQGGGLDEIIAALLAFSLIDRESIPDERDQSVVTDCVRLHRLVRQVAAARQPHVANVLMRGELIGAMAATYPRDVFGNPGAWLKARRLDAIALALVKDDDAIPEGAEAPAGFILDRLGSYRQSALGAFVDARSLLERAVAIGEKLLGSSHPNLAPGLSNLGGILFEQGDYSGARTYFERALSITEKLGPDDSRALAISLNKLGAVLEAQGDLAGARHYLERAVSINEVTLGPDHPGTAINFTNLAFVLQSQGELAEAKPYLERALAIHEKASGSGHPNSAAALSNLGGLLNALGDHAGAQSYLERALLVNEKLLPSDHPDLAACLNNLGSVLLARDDLAEARRCYERALGIVEAKLGVEHPNARIVAENTAGLFERLGLIGEAHALRRKFGLDPT